MKFKELEAKIFNRGLGIHCSTIQVGTNFFLQLGDCEGALAKVEQLQEEFYLISESVTRKTSGNISLLYLHFFESAARNFLANREIANQSWNKIFMIMIVRAVLLVVFYTHIKYRARARGRQSII